MSIGSTPNLHLPMPGGTVYDTRLGDIDAAQAALFQLDSIIFGMQGDIAAKAATGPTGPAGAQGANGLQGPQGPTGAQGLDGATGATGSTGATGATGATGPRGLQGLDGAAGPVGPQGTGGTAGSNGATGATGATGTNGVAGATGPTGPTGAAGTNGTIGVNGVAGATGATGATGTWSGTTTDSLTEGTTNKYYTAARAMADAGTLTLAATGDVVAPATAISTGTNVFTLVNSGVVAGTYDSPTITVDSKGRITGVGSLLSNTLAAISMNGAGGSTAFVDFDGNAVTVNGSSHVDTTTYSNGALLGSISLAATQTNGLIFGTNDFTIEFWVNETGWAAGFTMFVSGPNWAINGGNPNYNAGSWLSIPGNNQWGGTTVGWGEIYGQGWVHLAMQRQGNTLTAWRNGVLVQTDSNFTMSLESGATSGTITVGYGQTAGSGYVRGLRISNIARYSATFTPYTDLINGTYLPLSQNLAITGDVTGASVQLQGGTIATTLAASGVTAGTYGSASAVPIIVVDAKGRVTHVSTVAPTASKLTTAVNINGVPFDGSSAITVNAVDTTARVASSLVAAANGVASLDSSGKVPTAQMPPSVIGGLNYQGTWDANANVPALASGTGTKGFYYKVSTLGTTTLDGISSWSVNDTVVFDGTTWDKVGGSVSTVVSVAGKTGIVVLAPADVSLGNVTNVAQLAATQTLAHTGDVTGTATLLSSGTIALTLAASGVTAGTYTNVTVDAKGRVTAGTTTQAFSTITGTPTTLAGYGITDAYSSSNPSGFQTAAQVATAVASSGGGSPTTVALVTTWTGLPNDITGSCFGVPVASQVDIRFTAGRAYTIPANLAGSLVSAKTAATASAVWSLQKNGVTVATFTFAAGGTTATLSTQASIVFNVGDKLQTLSPSTVDATLADVDFTILAVLN